MTRILTVIIAGLLAGCASPEIESADGPIAADTVLIGETRNQRSMGDYERLLFAGVDQQRHFIPQAGFQREKNRFHRIPAGPHKVFVRVLATAHRGLPALRDGVVVFENVEFEGGRAYIINGERNGEMLDVWIEDLKTREHITSAVKIKPPRLGMPSFE
jgi:hypothetical protein